MSDRSTPEPIFNARVRAHVLATLEVQVEVGPYGPDWCVEQALELGKKEARAKLDRLVEAYNGRIKVIGTTKVELVILEKEA